jgi:hypothetical protein
MTTKLIDYKPSKVKTPKKRKRKFNEKKVQRLTKRGVNASDVAKNQGVAVSTITRYLKTIEPQLIAIEQYSTLKADSLCLSQLRKQAVEDVIVNNWLANPKELLTQDMRLQKEIVHTMQGGKDYDHRAERLERNKSTANIAMKIQDIDPARLEKLKNMAKAMYENEE